MRITNCHVHTFTRDHVPPGYPSRIVGAMSALPWIADRIGHLIQGAHPDSLGRRLIRLARFGRTGQMGSQERVLERVIEQYPRGTRFVVLPVDMDHAGYGSPSRRIAQQHAELADLARRTNAAARAAQAEAGVAEADRWDVVIPFATITPCDPDRTRAFAAVRALVADGGFRGLKLYPKLGFGPGDPFLRQEVLPWCDALGLPVMVHCSRGGVAGRFVQGAVGEALCDPLGWAAVARAFPRLRLCLAHFGGERDWSAYAAGLPEGRDARRRNWLAAILDLLKSGEPANLWTDISYTLFHTERFLPFLKVFLLEPRVRARVLFGSDYYMTDQEDLSERAVSFRLRAGLGEDLFRQIAEINPEVWLGERAEEVSPASAGGAGAQAGGARRRPNAGAG